MNYKEVILGLIWLGAFIAGLLFLWRLVTIGIP